MLRGSTRESQLGYLMFLPTQEFNCIPCGGDEITIAIHHWSQEPLRERTGREVRDSIEVVGSPRWPDIFEHALEGLVASA